MGAALGRCLVAAGHEVLWVSDGRSETTQQRAEDAGLTDAKTLATLASEAQVIISVCPPHAASDVAGAVADHGFIGLFLDANAVAPKTAAEMAARFAADAFVDGGIAGPPPTAPDLTRLFLSGDSAPEIAALFEGTACEPVLVDDRIGSASATKIAFAAWTKCSSALLMSVADYAAQNGVEDALFAEWNRRFPGLTERLARTRQSTEPKAWRFVGEMHEIASAMQAEQLPSGFGEAAAVVYEAIQNESGRT